MNFRCCCESCIIAEDDFNRANHATNPGDQWLVVSGTWSITSEKLTTTLGNGLVRLLRDSSPAGLTDHVAVTVTITPGSNTQYRIVLSYEDADNYLFAELVPTTTGTLKLYSRAAGVDTELATTPFSLPSGVVTFYACLNPDTLKFRAAAGNSTGSGAGLVSASATLAASDFNNTGIVALAVGTISGTATFDDFQLIEVSEECDLCGAPTAACGGCCGAGDASEEYDVDIGAGGWVDASCTQCNEVSGVYTVGDRRVVDGFQCPTMLGGCCYWHYRVDNWCLSRTFYVNLWRAVTSPNCHWYVRVQIAAGIAGATAQYKNTAPGPCFVGSPLTLTKDWETLGGGLCTGSLPATITIQSVV